MAGVVLILEFWILDLGVSVLDLGLGCGSWSFGFWILDFGSWSFGLDLGVSVVDLGVLDLGVWILDDVDVLRKTIPDLWVTSLPKV